MTLKNLFLISLLSVSLILSQRQHCTIKSDFKYSLDTQTEDHNTRQSDGHMSEYSTWFSRYFDNGNSYSNVRAYKKFEAGINIGGTFTISFWVKFTDNIAITENDFQNRQAQYILNAHDDQFNGFGIIKDFDFGKGAKLHAFSRQNGQGSNHYYFDTLKKEDFDVWIHYAVIFKEQGHIIVYRNGEIQNGKYGNNQRKSITITNTNKEMAYIGIDNPGDNHQHAFYGYLDEFFIYDRALILEEVICMNDLCSYRCADKCINEYDNCTTCADSITRDSAPQCNCKSGFMEYSFNRKCITHCESRSTDQCTGDSVCELEETQCKLPAHSKCEYDQNEANCKADENCIWQQQECKTLLKSRCDIVTDESQCEFLNECQWSQDKCIEVEQSLTGKCQGYDPTECDFIPGCINFGGDCVNEFYKCDKFTTQDQCKTQYLDCYWNDGKCNIIDDYKHCSTFTSRKTCDNDNKCNYLYKNCTTTYCTENVLDNVKDYKLEVNSVDRTGSQKIKFLLYLHDGQQNSVDNNCFTGSLELKSAKDGVYEAVNEGEEAFNLELQYVQFIFSQEKLDQYCKLSDNGDQYECDFSFILQHQQKDIVRWDIKVWVQVNTGTKAMMNYSVGIPEIVFFEQNETIPIASQIQAFKKKFKNPEKNPKFEAGQLLFTKQTLKSQYLKQRFFVEAVEGTLQQKGKDPIYLNIILKNPSQKDKTSGLTEFIIPPDIDDGKYILSVTSELLDIDEDKGAIIKTPQIRKTTSKMEVEIGDEGMGTTAIIIISVLSAALFIMIVIALVCYIRRGRLYSELQQKYEQQANQSINQSNIIPSLNSSHANLSIA